MTTTLDERHIPHPDSGTTRLRVVLLLDVLDGRQENFLAAYEAIRHQVASVPGHLSDQLCQSLGNSSQWLITSEWENSERFLEWVESSAHRKMVEPLHGCVRDTTSLRFLITRETPEPGPDGQVTGGHRTLAGAAAAGEPGPVKSGQAARTAKPAKPGGSAKSVKPAGAPRSGKPAGAAKPGRPGKAATSAKARPVNTPGVVGRAPRSAVLDPLPAPPLCTGGVVRHAITFTVKPGSEQTVAGFLASYRSPRSRVDADTQLRRTSLFMHGNRVVRAVEVTGDLGNALRYVAAQPEIRTVEEAINPYLEEVRDLTDPASARAFFARAALPAVEHITGTPGAGEDDALIRHAFFYPVRSGHGAEAAGLLAELDAAAAAEDGQPLAGSTVFHRDDLLVRVIDLRKPHRGARVGAAVGGAADALSRLLDLDPRHGRDGGDATGLSFGGRTMSLVTDRRAQDDA